MLVTLLGIVTEVRPVQPEKADAPILVTLLGMVMEVRSEQPKNACSPIVVTLLGMVTEVRPVQPEKAKCAIPFVPSLMLISPIGRLPL